MNAITQAALACPSDDVIRRNPHVFPVGVAPVQKKTITDQPGAIPGKPVESADGLKLNKLERSFWEHLQAGHRLGLWWEIGCQDVTLKLANDCRYTPDFRAVPPHGGREVFFEVKGFWRDDAKVKLKVAANKFRTRIFIVVTRRKGQWCQEIVHP